MHGPRAEELLWAVKVNQPAETAGRVTRCCVPGCTLFRFIRIKEVVCPFLAFTGDFFQCLQSLNKAWPLSSCPASILAPVFVSTGILAPAPSWSCCHGREGAGCSPSPVPGTGSGAAAPQEGTGVGTEVLGDRSPLIPGSGAGWRGFVPTGASPVPVSSLGRAVPQPSIQTGCQRGAGSWWLPREHWGLSLAPR